ncbi:MAG: AI-2E family transporter [Dorea sp.]|jgi:predicted PurR-regulated permease PerM|nr:AI-2E family transporter [Dorea sp.]
MKEQEVEKEKQEEVTETERQAHYSNPLKFGKGGPSKLRQQFSRGMTYFLVVAASLLFYFALLRLTSLSESIEAVIGVLKPVIYGCVIAYLLNPVVKQVDKYMVPLLQKKMTKPERAEKVSRAAGILAAIVLLMVIIVTLCNLLIPELYSSVRDLVVTMPKQLNDIVSELSEMELDESTTSTIIKTGLKEGTDMLLNWLRTDLMGKANELMSNLTVGVLNILSEVFSAVIGIIVSIYILFSKELFVRQSKKCVYALFSARHANLLLHLTTKSNEIFGGFVIGKIIDSAIIGILCFIGLTILKMPYALLVSVIVGVTNVIPFFGPYIGAVPSTILIMIDTPIKGIYFIIFILLLQQFDGNILGPKILGDSTGLSAFWVIVAILLGGGLFGFVGMVMGVPSFAVMYYIVQMLINSHLERKNLPTGSEYYDTMSYVDDAGVYYHSEETENIAES